MTDPAPPPGSTVSDEARVVALMERMGVIFAGQTVPDVLSACLGMVQYALCAGMSSYEAAERTRKEQVIPALTAEKLASKWTATQMAKSAQAMRQ